MIWRHAVLAAPVADDVCGVLAVGVVAGLDDEPECPETAAVEGDSVALGGDFVVVVFHGGVILLSPRNSSRVMVNVRVILILAPELK